jgi:adenine-specific DNA methylase
MVFAISGRGKTTGAIRERMEVGSWVIGFWRPKQHFEVNVWNCFERRVLKLVKALNGTTAGRGAETLGDLNDINMGIADCALVNGSVLDRLPELLDGSVDLFITDPPHSDRIPYLELSELWNVVLGETPDFASEIIVSNAKERSKGNREYNDDMFRFLEIATAKLSPQGSLVLFFNARSASSWTFFDRFVATATAAGMNYNGCFPLVYSAGSVVQDSREGALKTDYGLVFSRTDEVGQRLSQIPGWISDLPTRA